MGPAGRVNIQTIKPWDIGAIVDKWYKEAVQELCYKENKAYHYFSQEVDANLCRV